MTEFEKWQEEAQKDYARKRSKANHAHKTGLDNMSSTYQRLRNQNEPTGMKRNASDLKQSIKMDAKSLLQEEDFDISEYLDMKIASTTKMTGDIKSTLSRFDSNFGKPSPQKNIIISENNSSDEEEKDDDKT